MLWVVPPTPHVPNEGLAERLGHYADALREVAARHPGQVAAVDLAAWLAAQPEPPDRPDGLHWSRPASSRVADEFLGPVLVAAGLT